MGMIDCTMEEDKKLGEAVSGNKPLLIFKVNCMITETAYKHADEALRSQVKDGVVLLPPYISLEAIVGEDCNIRIVKESED